MQRAVLLLAVTLQSFLYPHSRLRDIDAAALFQLCYQMAATSYRARADDSRAAAFELRPRPFVCCCNSSYFHPGAPASCRSRSSPNALALFFFDPRCVSLLFGFDKNNCAAIERNASLSAEAAARRCWRSVVAFIIASDAAETRRLIRRPEQLKLFRS